MMKKVYDYSTAPIVFSMIVLVNTLFKIVTTTALPDIPFSCCTKVKKFHNFVTMMCGSMCRNSIFQTENYYVIQFQYSNTLKQNNYLSQ